MNFKVAHIKVTVLILLALILSACSSSTKQPSKPNFEPVVAAPTLNDDPSLEPGSVSDVKVGDITIPTRPAPRHSSNILDRIRLGFAFPDLNTKTVSEHERWASEHPNYLNDLFGRAEPFLYFIVNEIEKRGLPMELALLPAVESAYDPGAVSHSSAAGLWQFVPATGKGFGLRQDWWYDGRHDPYSSTYAALDYLEQLHKMFDGDWFIALAAYNAGPGTLRREIRRAKNKGKKTDYLSLNLRAETRRYIPKLMALRRIVQNPHLYDMVLPAIANQPYFELLDLPGQVDLVEFAKSTNIDQQLLRHLNRGFKRWATPPDGPHRILVPLSSDAANSLANVDYAKLAVKNSPKVNYLSHTISKGDTLSGIARTYDVPVSELRSANRLSSNNIRAGKKLMIPSRDTRSEKITTQASATSQSNGTTKNSSGAEKINHRVEKGDTLWSIARHYRVNLKELMAWNNLGSGDILSLDQLLTVFIN